MIITRADIVEAIKRSGIAGEVVCLHSSLRSFGEVAGGADTVVGAFLNAGCTLLAPSFTEDFQIPPPEEIERNGWEPGEDCFTPNGRIYEPGVTDIDDDMGAIPRAMINTAGRHRGYHPTNSFVALGSKSERLAVCQTPGNVYGPFQEAMDERGYIVMAGVDLTKMTAIHYAEQLSGRELFVRWALDCQGVPMRIRVGSCSNGFNNLLPTVAALEKRVLVGGSLWRVFPFFETVHACTEAIRKEPGVTHCGKLDCARCNDIVRGGPIL